MSSKIFTPVIVDSNMAAPNAGTRASVLFKADSFNQNGSIMISLVLFFPGRILGNSMSRTSLFDSSTKKHPVGLLYCNLPSMWLSGALRFCASSVSAARFGIVTCVTVWSAPAGFYTIFRVLLLFVVFLLAAATFTVVSAQVWSQLTPCTHTLGMYLNQVTRCKQSVCLRGWAREDWMSGRREM